MASVDAALLLFTRLTAKLTEYNEHYLKVLLVSMTIILLSLSKLDQSEGDTENKVKEVLEKATQKLKDWVIHKDVIGGSLFGGKVMGTRLCHPIRELEVCFIYMVHRNEGMLSSSIIIIMKEVE